MIYGNSSESNVYCTVTRLLYISYLCDGVWVELITGFGIFLWPLSLCITSRRLILGNQAYKKHKKIFSLLYRSTNFHNVSLMIDYLVSSSCSYHIALWLLIICNWFTAKMFTVFMNKVPLVPIHRVEGIATTLLLWL